MLLLENISTSIKVGPEQLPSVHQVLLEAATCLGMEAPDLYIRQNPVPNAYTLAIGGRKPFIVVHTSLLELLTLDELQAVRKSPPARHCCFQPERSRSPGTAGACSRARTPQVRPRGLAHGGQHPGDREYLDPASGEPVGSCIRQAHFITGPVRQPTLSRFNGV